MNNSQLYDGVPLIVAWGKPVSGKTTAAKSAMALIGQQDAVGGIQAQPIQFCFAAAPRIVIVFLLLLFIFFSELLVISKRCINATDYTSRPLKSKKNK